MFSDPPVLRNNHAELIIIRAPIPAGTVAWAQFPSTSPKAAWTTTMQSITVPTMRCPWRYSFFFLCSFVVPKFRKFSENRGNSGNFQKIGEIGEIQEILGAAGAPSGKKCFWGNSDFFEFFWGFFWAFWGNSGNFWSSKFLGDFLSFLKLFSGNSVNSGNFWVKTTFRKFLELEKKNYIRE